MNSSYGIPHVENIHELLSLPSYLFVREAYRCVLRREADETGLLNYMEALSRGLGKYSILISLMNSGEARQLGNANRSGANSDVLSRELAKLYEVHNNKRIVHRIFQGKRSRVKRKEFNKLEFRLECMFLSMIDKVKSEISQEITYRVDLHNQVGQPALDLYHEVGKTAQSNLLTVQVIQAQRRSASRPGSEG